VPVKSLHGGYRASESIFGRPGSRRVLRTPSRRSDAYVGHLKCCMNQRISIVFLASYCYRPARKTRYQLLTVCCYYFTRYLGLRKRVFSVIPGECFAPFAVFSVYHSFMVRSILLGRPKRQVCLRPDDG